MLMENLLLTVVGLMLLRETLLHAIALNEIVAFPEIKVNSVILVKFIYSEKATKFCEIFPLLLTTVHTLRVMG